MLTEAQLWGLGNFASYGFTLEHPDDHIVVLFHQGGRVANFSQTGATEESIQAECARHLVMKHHWDGALWQSAS
jgi:hypothetical protein